MAGRRRTNLTKMPDSPFALRAKHGGKIGSTKKPTKVTDESQLSPDELSYKQAYAIFLKASDFSYAYISDTILVQRSIVKLWFEDEEIRKRVIEVQTDVLGETLTMMRNAVGEAWEMLMDMARNTTDPKIKLQAVLEILDRGGAPKLNKSARPVDDVSLGESLSAKLSAMDDLSPEQLQHAARAAQAFEAAVSKQPEEVA